jgi:cytochrome c peroxidase
VLPSKSKLAWAFWPAAVVAFSVLVADGRAGAQDSGPYLPDAPFNYEGLELPEHYLVNGFGEGLRFQSAAIDNDNTPADNPVTNEGATLGRVLFYDKNLSANGSISCSSCHVQQLGFASPVTVGFEGEMTRRHTMSLTNARFYERGFFFWDERAESLEDQVLRPFIDPVEMGLTLDGLLNAIDSQSYYGTLFADAFGDEETTPDRISKALAQFVRSIVSIDTRYDEGRAMVSTPFIDFGNFTREENDGKGIFLTTGCSSCHVTEAFINVAEGPTNNGLDAEFTDDLGAFETFGDPDLVGTFKVPSLRNVEVTGPYMHDGRFETLEEVLEHYSTGVRHDSVNLGTPLVEPLGRQGFAKFSDYQKSAMIAFLKTLTDNVVLTTERLSDPFVRPEDRVASATPLDGNELGPTSPTPSGGGPGPGIYVGLVALALGGLTVYRVVTLKR